MDSELRIAPSKILDRLNLTLKKGGGYYSLLYAARFALEHVMDAMDGRLARIEQKQRIIETWSISSRRFTASDNKKLYNLYDWSQQGEEWTPSSEWKQEILNRYLLPYVPEGGTILEIGPGAGRWTEILQKRATKLIVVDVAERALSICRERFADCRNIDFLIGDGHTIKVPDASLDAIWSYDVFVHINPVDAMLYFQEFSRVLRRGAYAVIHHPGSPAPGEYVRPGGRSDLTDLFVLKFIEENELEFVTRCQAHVNSGDFVSVIRKP